MNAVKSLNRKGMIWRLSLRHILIFLLSSAWVVSCKSKEMEKTAQTLLPTATEQITTPTAVPPTIPTQTYVNHSPQITATPIPYDGDASYSELTSLLREEYSFSQCVLSALHMEEIATGEPEFIPTSPDFNLQAQKIWEIAESLQGDYRAYLIEEPIPHDAGTGFRLKLYVEEQSSAELFQLDWDAYIASRPIVHPLWIGNEILVFSHSPNPYVSHIIGVNVMEQSFVYYVIVYYDCPLDE